MKFTILKWDVSISLDARWNLSHFKIHRTDSTWHLVWGELSFVIENWAMEIHPVCAECGGTEIGEKHYGDEGLTVCSNCCAIEQGYKYVNLRDYENAP